MPMGITEGSKWRVRAVGQVASALRSGAGGWGKGRCACAYTSLVFDRRRPHPGQRLAFRERESFTQKPKAGSLMSHLQFLGLKNISPSLSKRVLCAKRINPRAHSNRVLYFPVGFLIQGRLTSPALSVLSFSRLARHSPCQAPFLFPTPSVLAFQVVPHTEGLCCPLPFFVPAETANCSADGTCSYLRLTFLS